MKKFLIPLGLFFGLVIFLGLGLQRDPHEIPSPLINKPAPAFSLPTLDPAAAAFSPDQMARASSADFTGGFICTSVPSRA